MKAFVFTDAALARDAGRFVWLAIDTENAKNAAFKTKYGVQVLPTLFVIDPKKEKIAIRWLGGATVPQLRKLLDDGERSVRGKDTGADQILARADRAFGDGRNSEAAALYKQALAKAPAKWPRYARTTEQLLAAMNDSEEAAKTARDAYPKLRDTPSAANIAATGLASALAMPASDLERVTLIETMHAAAEEVLANKSVKFAADDLSAVYGTLVDERDDAKDEAGKKKTAEAWAQFLEGQAAAAKTPEQRAVFDPHRVGAYLLLEQPERGVKMLQDSERDLPGDYNPSARLAVIYKAMKRWEDALAASDRALTKAYGPRKIGILQTRADIFNGKGDPAKAKATIEEAIQFAESLPTGQRSDRQIAALKKKLAGMG
jgi:hypothetical protein